MSVRFIWSRHMPAAYRWAFTERVVTAFGAREFAAIVAYCKRKKMSLYGLAKKAIREYMENNS